MPGDVLGLLVVVTEEGGRLKYKYCFTNNLGATVWLHRSRPVVLRGGCISGLGLYNGGIGVSFDWENVALLSVP